MDDALPLIFEASDALARLGGVNPALSNPDLLVAIYMKGSSA